MRAIKVLEGLLTVKKYATEKLGIDNSCAVYEELHGVASVIGWGKAPILAQIIVF